MDSSIPYRFKGHFQSYGFKVIPFVDSRVKVQVLCIYNLFYLLNSCFVDLSSDLATFKLILY